MTTSVPTFNFLALLISEIKRVSQNLMWGLLAPAVPRTLKLLWVLKILDKVKQRAKFQHRIFMHHAVMRICISHRLTIICAQKWVFWWFWGWRCESVVFWPPKGTTLREYVSVDVSRDKIGSTAWALGRWKNFCVRRNKKKLSGNFGYMVRSNPWGDLDQMWLVGRYGGRNPPVQYFVTVG